MQELDSHLAAVGRTEIDHDLEALEGAVWAKVDELAGRSLQPMPTRMAAAVCFVAAILASGAGAATAVATARAPDGLAAFAIHAPLAPSSILSD